MANHDRSAASTLMDTAASTGFERPDSSAGGGGGGDDGDDDGGAGGGDDGDGDDDDEGISKEVSFTDL